MQSDYWKDKWKEGDIGFHQGEVEPILIKYFSVMPPGRVLVPLCGKTKDMKWLIDKGWQVIGIEVSPLACQSFFVENNMTFKESIKKGKKVFEAEAITIFCEDLFSMTSDDIGELNAVYDRAALIALPLETRSQYAQHILNLLLSHSSIQPKSYLLIALEYLQSSVQGPPFSVLESEVKELYLRELRMVEFARDQENYLPTHSTKFAGLSVFETTYLFSR